MNISPASPVSGRLRTDNAANNANAAGRNGQDGAAGRTSQPQPARQSGEARPVDTYEPGTGAAARAAGTGQPDPVRDVTDAVAQRNAYAANAAVVERQNEVAGTTLDLVG